MFITLVLQVVYTRNYRIPVYSQVVKRYVDSLRDMIYIWTINAQYHWEKKKTGYYQTALDMEIDFGS